MSLPNILSLSRIPVLFLIGILLCLPFKIASVFAFCLFVLGAFTDWLDGFIARRFSLVSNFGKLIDALTDKIFVVGLFVVLLATSILPDWSVFFVLAIIAREFFITGLRLVAATQGRVIAAEKWGKIKTTAQLICLGTLILGHALDQNFTSTVYTWIVDSINDVGVVMLIVATYFTVRSGIGYMIKYWDIFTNEAGE